MHTAGEFSILEDRFQFELNDCFGVSHAPHQFKVTVLRNSDGLKRELFMRAHANALTNLGGFIHDRLNLLLTGSKFEQIPELLGGAADTLTKRGG